MARSPRPSPSSPVPSVIRAPRLWRWSALFVVLSSVSACGPKKALVPLMTTRVTRGVAEGKAPVETELFEVTFRLQSDGTYTRTQHHRYRILDASGVEHWAHIEGYYAPWYMEKPTLSATVENPGSAPVALDPGVLAEQPAFPDAPDLYGDSRTIRGPLPAVRVGSVIDETVSVKTHKPFLSKSQVHSVVFASPIPKTKVRLVVDAPADVPLRFEVRDVEAKKSERTEGGRKIVTYEGGPFPALEVPEDMLPSDAPYWPQIAFGTGTSWHELASQYSEVVDRTLEGIDFQTTVAEIVSPKDSEEQKVAKIHAWLKDHVRYVGIEFGESAVVPYRPDQTVGRGFGDCKDQATLLVGLLRAAGIDANVALLRAGVREDILPDLPALNVFDHAIVKKAGKNPLWIDPTADFLQTGALPPSDQGRFALVARGGTKDLEKTPSLPATTNRYREERTMTLASSGKASVLEKTVATGVLDSELRSSFRRSPEEVKKQAKSYIESAYDTKELVGVEHGSPFDLLHPFEVKIEAAKTTYGQTALLGANASLAERTVTSWIPNSLRPTDAGARKSPLQLHLPYRAELAYRIVPPKGFVSTELPENQKKKWGNARWERSVRVLDDRSVAVETSLELAGGTWQPSEVEAFRGELERWGESLIPTVRFEHESQKFVREGQVQKAIGVLRTEVKESPRTGIERMRLARTLLPFAREAALEEAKKSVEIEPKSAFLQEEYADLLALNLLGEDLGPGYDRPGAIAAYAKAAELGPDELGAKLRHAVVLEHDELGERYASAELDEAIRIYDSIDAKELREYADGNFANNALFALYWARKHDELRRRLAEMPRDDVPSTLAVMNEARRKGTALAAHEEAERLTLDRDGYAAALSEASAALVQDRSYPEAVKALEFAMQRSSSPEGYAQRARLLRKTKRLDFEKLPESRPEQVVLKMYVATLARLLAPEKVAERFLSKDARSKGKDSAAVRKLVETAEVVRPRSLTPEVFADITMPMLSTDVQGDDALGYRVKVKQDSNSNVSTFVEYVVKENGKYRIRVHDGMTDEMGAEALLAVQKKDVKKATTWLEWARESFHAVGGEDPLRLAPFARLWGTAKGDPLLAAAALAATSDQSAGAAGILTDALEKSEDPERRQILRHALALAYLSQKKYDNALEHVERLGDELPKSDTAFWLRIGALSGLDKYSIAEKAIEKRLTDAKERERVGLRTTLAEFLEHQGKLKESRKIAREIIAKKEASANLYNSAAWIGVFLGVTAEDLEYAQRAVDLDPDPSALHTLATVYAALGKLGEARRTFESLLERRKDKAPLPIDHLVLGLIAEQLGLKEVALREYARVTKSEKDSPTSSHQLALLRAKKLR